MFKPVTSRVNFPRMEEEILSFWKQNDIFNKSVINREGGARFVLYEGPPTANGSPGIHFAMPRVLKDLIPRYKAMKGYYTPRIGGWDTHGLPVELEIEKSLGFSGKAQIEEYGIEEFNNLCRQSVLRYIKEFEEVTERTGFWIDLDNAYVTMNNSYIESVWWALKQMWDKGLIYQGYKVTPHCPRCGTSLSSHEVAQGYQDDTEDPSVYIKFHTYLKSKSESERLKKLRDLVGGKKTYLLAWTTTPWTLPGNTALAVAEDAEYAVVEVDGEYLILAEARIMQAGLEGNPVVDRITGKELVGVEYEPLFNPHDFDIERRRFKTKTDLVVQDPDKNLYYRVIATDFVSMEDGTGIVHIAPSYGEVDYQAGQDHGLDFIHTVDLQGNITGKYPFAGKFVKAADPMVLEDLKNRGLLFKAEIIKHTYPFCWRCDAPLLYYAKQTWYIRTTAVKDALIAGNEEINWYPEHIKYGRFGNWLENNVDWAFSRERYWGTPLPVWRCEKCGSLECIGSVTELEGKPGFSGLKEPSDLHRPYVDDVTFNCSRCSGVMKRQPEVIDCWFDSGAMPFAQLHYPAENKELFDSDLKQADFICEAIDQTRGWFYSLHAISTLLFGYPCYKNVICHGHILDAAGEKMSKSKGNVVDLWATINKHGADTLRWYLYTAVPMGNSIRFDENAISEISRRLLMTLWNVYSFFVTYANIDNYVPDAKKTVTDLPELDRWILSELNQLIINVDAALDKYDPRTGALQIANFIDGLSNWYVRRSRRRFWKSENDNDKLSAYNTLYHCLVTLTRLMAPFTPFIAEEMYLNLVCAVLSNALESVHLTDFPVVDESKIDRDLSEDIRQAMKISSLQRANRAKKGIKVRQPLGNAYVIDSHAMKRALENESVKQSILDEINAKNILLATEKELAEMASKPDLYVVDDISSPSTAIDIKVTSQLEAEGLAREIVHRLQNMRRSAGFEIADYIATFYQGDEYVRNVMTDFAGYLKQETLSGQLIDGEPVEGTYVETHKLSGHAIVLGVKKQD